MELTELTVEDFRSELGQLRAFGRTLQSELERSGNHEHLRGRLVMVSPSSGTPPRNPMEFLTDLLALLEEDRGSLNDVPVDPAEGLPEQLPDVGFYGDIGGLNVHLNGPPGEPGRILVASSGQAQIRRSEVIAALNDRVMKKDRAENEVLLITCGLPDKHGYLCAVDEWIYHLLDEVNAEDALTLTRRPEHLIGVAIHSFTTGRWLEIYRSPDVAVPWAGDPPST